MLIAEFVRATGLSRDTIRFYVKKRLLQPEIRLNRYQDFDAEQVDRALLIREHQALGFTLREIATLSEEFSRGISLQRQAQVMRETAGRYRGADGKIAAFAPLLGCQDCMVGWRCAIEAAVVRQVRWGCRELFRVRAGGSPRGQERRQRTPSSAALRRRDRQVRGVAHPEARD